MANLYVYNGAPPAGAGTSWATAYQTLAAALDDASPPHNIYVAHDHAETQGTAMALASSGTAAAPNQIFCVNRAGSVPPVAADLRTTATVSTTVASSITYTGHAYCYGITFTAGSSTSAASHLFAGTVSHSWILDTCNLYFGTTSNASAIGVHGVSAGIPYRVEWINTKVKFLQIQQSIQHQGAGRFIWRDTPTAVDPGVVPTILFHTSVSVCRASMTKISRVDFSALTSGKTLIGPMTASVDVVFEKCKIDSAVTRITAPTGVSSNVSFINCESTLSNYKHEKHMLMGKQTVETTITRTGTEATDKTQAISAKIETTANAKPVQPFEMTPIVRWNDTIGSVTVTMYGIWGGGAVPKDDDIWMEVSYLDDASSTMGGMASSAAASYASTLITGDGTNLTSDSSVWGGGTTAFKMAVTITPTAKGPITVQVKAGLASSTFYVDPVPAIAGQVVDRAFAA